MKKNGTIIFLFKDGHVKEYNTYSSMNVFEYTNKIKEIIKEKHYLMYFSNCNNKDLISIKNIFFFKIDNDIERAFIGNFFFFTTEKLNLNNCIAVNIIRTNL